jgi:hypothetical protein
METHHVDLVRVDNFRPLAEPASPRSAERCQNRNFFVGAPYPARAEPCRAQGDQSRVSTPVASFSQAWRWPGWDHYRIPMPLGRPSPTWRHACRGRGRSCRAPRTGCGPVSTPGCHASVHDRSECDMSRVCRHPGVRLASGASCARATTGLETPKLTLFWNPHICGLCHGSADHPRPPGRIDPEMPPFMVIPSQAQRTTASRVGTRQRRARPRPACPQAGNGCQRNPGGSVLLPTRPPPRARNRASRWTARETRACARTASGPGRERRANATCLIKSAPEGCPAESMRARSLRNADAAHRQQLARS